MTETFSEPPGETMFFPEPRWQTLHVVRAPSGREVERGTELLEDDDLAATGD